MPLATAACGVVWPAQRAAQTTTAPASNLVSALNPSGYMLWSVPGQLVLLTYEESTLLLRSAFCLLARFRQKVKFKNSEIE
jgi:hypothetical protein